MPQRVVVIYICSLCREESDEAAFVTDLKITFGKTQRTLDVCKACVDTEPLAGLLDRAQPEKTEKSKSIAAVAEEEQCQYCSEWFTPRGMSLHLSRAHNVKSQLVAKKEKVGQGPNRCPECGFGAHNPQGLGVHRLKAHGVKGKTTR